MADSKKYNGSTWEHSLRKLATATDTITTFPVDVYADGNNATVSISGNTVQNGTPTPSNPIMPQGCGDLETVGTKAGQYKIPILSASTTTPVYLGEVETTRRVMKLVLTGDENWSVKQTGEYKNFSLSLGANGIRTFEEKSTHFQCIRITESGNTDVGFCIIASGLGLRIRPENVSTTSLDDFKTYLQQQYAAGTPVTVWYVLTSETTGIVNEPLMKIREYADEVSGISIPTIAGADSFDVETTLKPSEASLNYTGWHDATVEEWDGSQWNE